jgi:hypothetical protein
LRPKVWLKQDRWEEAVRVLFAMTLVALLTAGPSVAQVTDSTTTSAEGWVLSQLKQGLDADFNWKCGATKPLPTHDECRELSPTFIAGIVLDNADGTTFPHTGVRIKGAIVTGPVDLEDGKIVRGIAITASRINGNLNLARAQFEFGLSLKDSDVDGGIDGGGMRMGRDLRLESTTAHEVSLIGAIIYGFAQFKELHIIRNPNGPSNQGAAKLILNNAEIHADLNLQHVTVPDGIEARAMTVGGNADLTQQTTPLSIEAPDATFGVDLSFGGTFKSIRLDSAHIRSTLHMEHGTFGNIDLTAVRIDHTWGRGGSLQELKGSGMHVLQHAEIYKDAKAESIDFTNAVFNGNLEIAGLTVANRWKGKGLHVDGNLFIKDSIISGNDESPLDLSHAHIGEDLDLTSTRFVYSGLPTMQNAGVTTAPQKQINRIIAVPHKPVNMTFVRIGANLDLSNATLSLLDLSDAYVEAEFRLANDDGSNLTQWRPDPTPPPASTAAASADRRCDTSIRLVNAHAGTLILTNLGAWPMCIELNGFEYSRLGSLHRAVAEPRGGDVAQTKSPEDSLREWRQWLERDSSYRSQPYQQLARVMAAEGDRDNAAAIQYFAREQERAMACKNGEYGTCFALTALWAMAGYGIGNYTWRAVYWVLGLTVVGSIFVFSVRDARRRGLFWPVGASIEKLLPYVQLDPSFTNFFERQEGFRWWHKVVFCALALMVRLSVFSSQPQRRD